MFAKILILICGIFTFFNVCVDSFYTSSSPQKLNLHLQSWFSVHRFTGATDRVQHKRENKTRNGENICRVWTCRKSRKMKKVETFYQLFVFFEGPHIGRLVQRMWLYSSGQSIGGWNQWYHRCYQWWNKFW